MKNRYFAILIFSVLGVLQFLVIPTFSSMDKGGKVALFSAFTIILAISLLLCKREWIVPKALVPLVGLGIAFLVSLMLAKWPILGLVELYTFSVGLLFCLIVANLSNDSHIPLAWIYSWLQIVGSIVAILCLYQYADWIVAGTKNEMLIPYLLPPASSRVNGVFGQSNLTALLLLLTIVAFLHSYVSKKVVRSAPGGLCRDLGFLFVSTSFFLTGSRAGLVAFFAILAVMLFLILRKKLAASWLLLIRPVSILLTGFIFTLLPLSPEVASSVYIRGGVSVDARFLFWTVSFLIFLDAPFFGVGLDHFKLLLPDYARKAHDVLGFVQYEAMGYTSWSHNEYLQILAESGIVGFLFLTIFCLMLIRIMFRETLQKEPDTERSFLFILILPFFVQAIFSWPFRHPALLFIFFFILGIILSKASKFRFHLRPMAVFLITVIFAASFSGIAFFSFKEYRFNKLKKEVIEKGCGSGEIINYMNDPYLKFKILREVLPLCISDESYLEDRSLMEGLKPYFLEISNLQGTYSQWYNLGLIYRNLGEYAQAEQAFQKAVERQPVFELGWSALHALHVEEAARQTGRPIEEFLPPDKQYSADYYDSLFKRQ